MVEGRKQQAMDKGQKGRLKTTMIAISNPMMAIGSTKIGSAILDLTPFLGGLKQINEAVDGKKYTGEKLTGKKRLVHGLVGIGSLALDCTGIGEVGKGFRVIGKTTGAMKGIAGKLGTRGATKSAALMEKSAAFMTRNPELVRAAENVAENHIDDGIRYVKNVSRDDARKTIKEEAGKYFPPEIGDKLVDATEREIGNTFSQHRQSPVPNTGSNDASRKSSLLKNRQGHKPRPASFKDPRAIPYATKQNEMSPTNQLVTKPIASTADRKATMLASRAKNLGGGLPPLPSQPYQPLNRQETRDADDQEAQEEQEEQELQQQQRSSLLQQATMSQMNESQDDSEGDKKKNAAQDAMRKEVKKKAKAAFKRGFIFVIGIIAAALDLGTAGISFIIDIFVYIFSFGWLNVEMIYGTHIAKGKSKLISPLSWDPIPMPVDPNGFWLQGLVVTADIALGVAIVIFGAGGMCILHDYVKLLSDPLKVGYAIAGGGGDLCLGGIMSLVVNGL
ncbi:MAG: pre-toxin TG domain-containing protein [Patescibacteria group bacterium]